MRMRKTVRLFCILLSITLLFGCGNSNVSTDENIELIEPVGSSASYVLAEKRDIVTYSVYSGKVVPVTSEIYFASTESFSEYGILPGSDVKAGETVVYASTKNYDEQIKNLSESIERAEKDYNEAIKDLNESLETTKKDCEYYGQVVSNFENMTEAEKKSYGGRGYDAEYADYKARNARSSASLQRIEQNIKKKTELYELDRSYNLKSLSDLKKKKNGVLANSDIDGKVVAINYFNTGDYIGKDTAVAAVGDFSNLEIKSDSIYKNDIKKAVDLYALINGERYEITYKELTLEEQEKAKKQKESYTTFTVNDPDHKVKAGDYVAIILVSSRKDDVLCVPKEAVFTENGVSYLYVYDGENSVYTTVKKGTTSGYYTEIVSGINEGDKIVTEFSVKARNNTDTLKVGRMSSNFSASGYIFYSKNSWITNPVEYGTTYIDELKVKRYERVEKGQVIATVHVSADDITIRSKERILLRAQEDLASLIADNENGSNDKAIESYNESIAEITKEINKMKSNAKVTEIKAPYSGIITSLNSFETGDILRYDTNIAMIAKEDDCFIVVEDASGLITCGNTATITYKDNDNKDQVATGEVVTVAPCALTESITTGYSLIKVSPEDLEKMASVNQGYGGWWMRSTFNVSVEIRVMDNVVMIPKRAVTLYDGVTYVTVLNEKGEPEYKSFVFGGSDNSNYWVAEGLSEGMVICLD